MSLNNCFFRCIPLIKDNDWKAGRGLAVKLWSVKVQVRSGLVQVWFRLQLKFNSLELDSEVGCLVVLQVNGE